MDFESDVDVGLAPAPAPAETEAPRIPVIPESDRQVGLRSTPDTGVTPLPFTPGPEVPRPYPDLHEPTMNELLADMSTPAVKLPRFEHKEDDSLALTAGKEVANVAISVPEFFESGLGLASLGFSAFAPGTVATAFTADMLHNLGTGIRDTYKNWDKMTARQKVIATIDLGATGIMSLAAGKGAVEGGLNFGSRFVTGPDVAARRAASAAEFMQNIAPTARTPQPILPAEPLEFPESTAENERIENAIRSREQRSSEEAQLQGVRQGQNVPTYPTQVRKETGGQAAGGGGAEPSPQVTPVTPAPDEEQLLTNRFPVGTRINYLIPGEGIARRTGTVIEHMPSGRLKVDAGQESPDFIDENQQPQIEPTAPSGVSVPLIVTREMHQSLADLGYPEWVRNTLRPDQAQEIIASQRQYVAPAATPAAAPAAAPETTTATAPPGIPEETRRTLLNRGYSNGEVRAMTPEQAAATLASGERPQRRLTPEMAEDARFLRDRGLAYHNTRVFTPELEQQLFDALQDLSKGDLAPIQAMMPVLDELPRKPEPPPAEPYTGIKKFKAETEKVGPDILDWLFTHSRLLSKTAAKKRWGKERFEANKSLWDDMPDDLPVHHQMAIFGGRTGPDVAATNAYNDPQGPRISAPDEKALWAAVRAASRERRGLPAGERREQAALAEGEQQLIAWQTSTGQREGAVEVQPENLAIGAVLHIGPDEVRVTDVTPEGEAYLDGGERFGEQVLREGDRIWVDRVTQPEGGADFVPEEEQPTTPAFPRVPAPLPKGIPEADREAAFNEHRARWDKYNADLAAWEAAQPQDRPIIFARGDNASGGAYAITPDPQGGWRATTFTKLYNDLDKIAPWGHERYNTRLEAVRAYALRGEPIDRLPMEVMTEEEIRQERERRNAPTPPAAEAPTAPEAPKTTKFGGAAPIGTIADNHIKALDSKGEGRWYRLDEDGNVKRGPGGKDPIPVNAKKHAALEAKAALPPPPAETRTPLQVLDQASKIKLTVPKGATMIRATSPDGVSVMSIRDAEEERNLFQGAGITRIEAGRIVRSGQFEPIAGDVGVTDVGPKTTHFAELAAPNLLNQLGARFGGDQLLGLLRNRLPPGEYEALQNAGIEEAFGGRTRVSREEVDAWLRQNGPRVEVVKLGEEGSPNVLQTRIDELLHELETKGYRFSEVSPDLVFDPEKGEVHVSELPKQIQKDIELVRRLQDEVADIDRGSARVKSGYTVRGLATPKGVKDMPGGVDILVRIPAFTTPEQRARAFARGATGRAVEGIKFISGHYEQQGQNLVVHVRGYMEKLPDGRKVFHVFEIQSDWAQQVRDVETGRLNPAVSRRAAETQGDPILRQYERLALKAAIEHARQNGADAIAISDAETAMMTEGHDQFPDYNIIDKRTGEVLARLGPVDAEDKANEWIRMYVEGRRAMGGPDYGDIEVRAEVPQESGMRLHYDQTLPRLAQELTGDRGTKVEFGTNKNAMARGQQAAAGGALMGPRADLIFRNPDGTPKTSITARLYDISKARPEFTIFGSDRAGRMLAATEGTPMAVEDVSAHLAQQYGIQPGGIVEVVNNPGAEWRGESDMRIMPGVQRAADGLFPYELTRIRINAAKLRFPNQIDEVFEHELAHGASEVLPSLTRFLRDDELMQVIDAVRGYPASELNMEARARTVDALAQAWKERNWFQKAVGIVMAWANKIGVPLTRLAAERIAAQAIADQLTLVRRGSVINPQAVTRVVHSLPNNAEEWHMKQFLNAIGPQAATIGGYLHRYTRQADIAERLGLSDRARALDGMVEARQLTELAQAMGGRVNYYDAIQNASSNGERSDVIKSAFESIIKYQQLGVDRRRQLGEKLAVLQSESFRNKLTRAAQRRERAELAEEVRRTYTMQVAASAGSVLRSLNALRTVGAASEQLQADLARIQQLPQFERAVTQHFDSIVNALSQTDRGISLLLGAGDRNGADIWDEYLRTRFANNLGMPQGNEFALGQLASAVLGVNRDLRNQFGSLALLSRDIITTQEWNRAASKIAQALQNDPVAAIPRILQRAARLGERDARAEAAFLTLNRGIQRTLRDYGEYEEAVRLHDAVEQDGEYRQWVNDVLRNPEVDGIAIPADVRARMEQLGKREPFFKYVGQDTLYSPDGKPYAINMQFTPENVQETMRDLTQLSADISEWMDRPENLNNPDRLYWQEAQRFYEGVLTSSAIWSPGAIKPLFFEKSFGIPESFFQTLALPTSKLAFLATKAFDRYFAQGQGWYKAHGDVSERAIQLAYKAHGFNELSRDAYRRGVLNAMAWEFRNGRDVRAGDIINGVKITKEDVALLYTQGKMISELYDKMWNTAKSSGAEGVMQAPRLVDEFGARAWGIRRPIEIGLHKNTTLPHHFSQHGRALADLIHSRVSARDAELSKLPQRIIDEGLDEAAAGAARADIHRRFNEMVAMDLNDPDIFQNFVLGFMRQRSEDWVKLDGLSDFEEQYREITRLVSNDDPTAPKTVEEVLDWISQHVPPEMTPEQVRAKFLGEILKVTERFQKLHAEEDTGVTVQTDKRRTVFTKGFEHDQGPAYFYNYGWIDAADMRQYGTDMGQFGMERWLESMRALKRNMNEAVAELTSAAEERKPEIVRETMEKYREGKDFRNLQTLLDKGIELDRLIAGFPAAWSGMNAVHAEGISLKSFNRFVSFMIGAALTGPRTAARISGISMGGSAWKMGIVFSQLGYGRLRSFPTAAASAITSAFRIGTATGLGWYYPKEGFVPGVPLRLLMNVPGALRAGLAAKGSEKLYTAIETVFKGVTDEQFAALGWWFDQKQLGLTPDTAIGARMANIVSASRTKGGVLSRPDVYPEGAQASVLRGVKLAVSKPWAFGEAFVAGTNVYLPGAFGYNVTYDAVGRQAGWYIDMLAANARRTFETYERLGQLDRFNFGPARKSNGEFDPRVPPDVRNKLQPWEVLPSFAGRFRFADPAKLPGWARPNSTNLQVARELFSTSTDVDLQDLLLRYWKRLANTPREQRGAVEFLAPEELDAARARTTAEGRARGIISRFVEQTHHAASSNRPYQLQKATTVQAILPFMGWSAQTLKLIDSTLGRAAFSAESGGVQADTYAGLVMAAGLTAAAVGIYAFIGGDLETRLIRELDRLLHNKEGTVKTIDEARNTGEAAEITLHNMTAALPLLNSTLNSILGFSGYRGGSAGFQAFAFDKVNSMLTYGRDVYRTHDLTHGLDRLAEANIPITETIIENTFQRQGLQNNRNAVRVLQKFGPQDLVERRASLSIALPTEMTPYRQALLEAIGSGDQKLVGEAYQAFIQKATELGRPEPDKLARQMFSTLNPYRQAFGGVLTDQQRADTLSRMSDTQRGFIETMERNYGLAAATLGLTADFEKQEKAPPLQRSGTAAGGAGGGAIPAPSGRALRGGGLGRIGMGTRRISLSGPKPPRARVPGLGVARAGAGAQTSRASTLRNVRGRLRPRSTRATIRRLTTRRPSRRRISLQA